MGVVPDFEPAFGFFASLLAELGIVALPRGENRSIKLCESVGSSRGNCVKMSAESGDSFLCSSSETSFFVGVDGVCELGFELVSDLMGF